MKMGICTSMTAFIPLISTTKRNIHEIFIKPDG